LVGIGYWIWWGQVINKRIAGDGLFVLLGAGWQPAESPGTGSLFC
jgi:hypothetical protein